MNRTSREIAKRLFVALGLTLAALTMGGLSWVSADASDLKIEEKCGPTTVRPNEWVVYECLVRLTNEGNTPLSNIASGYKSSSGIIPQYFFVLYELNGKPMPIDPTTTNYGGGYTLQPGQTANVRLDVLLEMPSEGVYDGEWQALVDGVEVPTAPLHFEGKADAAAPPRDLEVTQVGYSRGRQAVFETTITNNSSTDVTELSLTEHHGNGLTPAAVEPTGAELTDVNLLKLDLASFGRQSLGSGETLTLKTTYEGAVASGCPYAQSGMLVEATVNGERQLYGSSDGLSSICTGDGDVTSLEPVAGDGVGFSPLTKPLATGDAVGAPLTGQGSSSDSFPTALFAAVTAVGVANIGAAQLLRSTVRR